MVKEGEPTNKLMYSLNEGLDWSLHTFAETPLLIEDITTVPSDTSRKFLLWGKLHGDLTTIALDFSGLAERSSPCHLDEHDPPSEGSDYYLWEPKHPLSCLFGHIA
ncbi:vacuolar protein sorting/targeting protein PEP1, partial [Friedmanniomyces endolithicus]